MTTARVAAHEKTEICFMDTPPFFAPGALRPASLRRTSVPGDGPGREAGVEPQRRAPPEAAGSPAEHDHLLIDRSLPHRLTVLSITPSGRGVSPVGPPGVGRAG